MATPKVICPYVVAWKNARLTFALLSVCDVTDAVRPPQSKLSNVGCLIRGGRVGVVCKDAGAGAAGVRVMPRWETPTIMCCCETVLPQVLTFFRTG